MAHLGLHNLCIRLEARLHQDQILIGIRQGGMTDTADSEPSLFAALTALSPPQIASDT